jgi:hypothetical protein
MVSAFYESAPQGVHIPAAKLNDVLVKRIRKEHAAKEMAKKALDEQFSIAALAKKYGVHVNTIVKVLSYETWRHVQD